MRFQLLNSISLGDGSEHSSLCPQCAHFSKYSRNAKVTGVYTITCPGQPQSTHTLTHTETLHRTRCIHNLTQCTLEAVCAFALKQRARPGCLKSILSASHKTAASLFQYILYIVQCRCVYYVYIIQCAHCLRARTHIYIWREHNAKLLRD